MNKKIIILIAIIAMIFCFSALAQTNAPTITPQIAQTNGIFVTSAAEALGAFIHFSFPALGIGESMFVGGKLLVIVMILARILRKVLPDNLQVNKIGLALANVAGEVNPTIEKLAVAAQEKANKQKTG